MSPRYAVCLCDDARHDELDRMESTLTSGEAYAIAAEHYPHPRTHVTYLPAEDAA